MENKQIEGVDCTKFPGLYIDEKLNFKNHVNNLISKLNSIKLKVWFTADGNIYQIPLAANILRAC